MVLLRVEGAGLTAQWSCPAGRATAHQPARGLFLTLVGGCSPDLCTIHLIHSQSLTTESTYTWFTFPKFRGIWRVLAKYTLNKINKKTNWISERSLLTFNSFQLSAEPPEHESHFTRSFWRAFCGISRFSNTEQHRSQWRHLDCWSQGTRDACCPIKAYGICSDASLPFLSQHFMFLSFKKIEIKYFQFTLQWKA